MVNFIKNHAKINILKIYSNTRGLPRNIIKNAWSPEKHRKTFGFLIFSRESERELGKKWITVKSLFWNIDSVSKNMQNEEDFSQNNKSYPENCLFKAKFVNIPRGMPRILTIIYDGVFLHLVVSYFRKKSPS